MLVEADLGNCLIKRIVDTDLNRYVIKYKDNREETFNVVKDSVPSEVQSLLKHDSHNIQSQSESNFFVLSPAGQVAKLLNNVLGVGDIEAVVAEVSRRIRERENKRKLLESEAKELNRNLKNKVFKTLPDFVELYKKFVVLREEKLSIEEESSSLINTLHAISDYHTQLEDLKIYDVEESLFEEFDFNITELKNKKEEASLLRDNLNAVIKVNRELKTTFVLDNEGCKVFEEAHLTTLSYFTLKDKIYKVEEIEEKIKIIEEETEDKQKELDEVIGDLEICPLCETVLK